MSEVAPGPRVQFCARGVSRPPMQACTPHGVTRAGAPARRTAKDRLRGSVAQGDLIEFAALLSVLLRWLVLPGSHLEALQGQRSEERLG